MSIEIKKKIETCLQAFLTDNLTQNALNLFNTLGYNTDRQASLDKPNFPAFKAAYALGSTKFNEEKALVKEWKYVDLLFQLSKDEVTRQNSLFDTKRVDNKDIQSYLFFAIEIPWWCLNLQPATNKAGIGRKAAFGLQQMSSLLPSSPSRFAGGVMSAIRPLHKGPYVILNPSTNEERKYRAIRRIFNMKKSKEN